MVSALSDQLLLIATTGIGNVAGQRLLVEATEWFDGVSLGDDGALVIFELSAVELATTSFIKSSVLPLFQSARLSTDPNAQSMADAFGLPALNAYPVLANVQPEVEELADEIFGRRGFPLLSLKYSADHDLQGGRMLGYLDEALVRTMRNWPEWERHTAATLLDNFPDEGITQTAWSNRLNDLWKARLLRRIRQGKSWSYQPVSKGVTYG